MSTCSSSDGEGETFKYKLCKNLTYHKEMKSIHINK